MKFFKNIVSVFAIFCGLVARTQSELHQFCQSDLTECKCEYYSGTFLMDCSEMGIEEMPDFLEDKVFVMIFTFITDFNWFSLSLSRNK